jgi:hypothetical protein
MFLRCYAKMGIYTSGTSFSSTAPLIRNSYLTDTLKANAHIVERKTSIQISVKNVVEFQKKFSTLGVEFVGTLP